MSGFEILSEVGARWFWWSLSELMCQVKWILKLCSQSTSLEQVRVWDVLDYINFLLVHVPSVIHVIVSLNASLAQITLSN